MQFRLSAAFLIFIGSYTPLAIILAIQNIPFEWWSRPICELPKLLALTCAINPFRNPSLAILMVAFTVSSAFLASQLFKRIAFPYRIEVVSVKAVPNEIINYTFPYGGAAKIANCPHPWHTKFLQPASLSVSVTRVQKTFSELEYTGKKKQTRRDRFLADLEQLVPWAHLEAQVVPFYSNTAGKRGRPAIGVSRMLRMYVVQQCFGFSDEGCEDAVYDSQAIRGFMGIDLGRESAPDATTLLRFRRLLEANQLTRLLFETINQHLASRGLLLKEGTIVDATLIAAPPSVKNREGKRDPEMHQARKGNQWHFGMKAHIGVDATSGLVHSVVGTAANVADVTQVGQLLHGDETYVSGDAGYTGAAKRPEHAERDVIWSIAARPSSYKQHGEGSVLYRVKRKIEYAKAQLRAKVEHPFQVIKVRFNHRKVRYRGLEKNTAQLFSLFGLANLMLAKRYLQQAAG